MSDTDVRGSVQRHFHFDRPMWRAKVYDGDVLVAMHLVVDWADAMDLANSSVLQFRRKREEFAARLKQQILDAYGVNDWTPEERALFDAWGRVQDALKAEREAFAASIPARANAIASLVFPGVKFEWRADG